MKKTLVSIMLIIMIASNYSYDVQAEAATLTVATGAIATGGLSTAGFAALLTPAAVIVGVGLLACGVDVALTNASQSAGMTKTDFIKSKITSFCNATNKTVGQFCETILTGASIAKNGAIELTDQASSQIKQFGEWLFSNNQVIDSSNNVTNDFVTLGDLNLPFLQEYTMYGGGNPANTRYTFHFSEPIALIIVSNGQYLGWISNHQGVTCTYTRPDGSTGSSSLSNKYGSYYYNKSGWWSASERPITIDGVNLPVTDLDIGSYVRSLDGSFDITNVGAGDDTFTGTRDDWASGSNALDPAQDKTTVLNPGLVQGLDIPGVNDLVSTVQDYLDALQEALDKVGEIDLPSIDTITGENVNVGVGEDTFDPAIDKEYNQDLPQDKTPVTDPSLPAVGDLPIDQNTLDLKGVFPFCIPYDVVDMIRMLSADPTAPRYTVNWHIPIINEYLTFTVDLSPFNSVAEICRNMETILFCVGLALATRNIIRG